MKREGKKDTKRSKTKNIKKEIKNENKPNKKRTNKNLLIILVVLIALILLFLIFRSLSLTTKVIEKPPTPTNCSNESIKAVWNSIFKGGTENLTIVVAPNLNESNSSLGIFFIGGCPFYSVYKVNGSKLNALVGVDMWFLMDVNMIYAINGEFKPGKIENITSSLNNYSEIYANLLSITLMGFEDNNENNSLLPRNINNITEARSHFESIFKISSSNWTKGENWTEDLENINITIYSFNESEEMKNITVFGDSINPMGVIGKIGMVFGNSSLDEYIYSEMSLFGILETLEKKFGNWTSPINTSIKNITIQVNNSKLDILGDYQGKQKLKILENNKTIIETEVNFTDNFDWTKIVLKKQDNSSNVGYIIINGLNSTKNVTVDKLNDDSELICIKNKEINDISQISKKCNLSDEYLLACPGNFSNNILNLTCRISGNKFIVTGLTHSAVIEILPISEPCIPDWECDDWTDYDSNCGSRTCADLNNCENISNKPLEYQKCLICVPDWDCTKFAPKKCPKSERRTRTCDDLNDCGTSKGEPNLTQSCKIETNWMLIIGGILGGIIILIIIIMLTKGKKNEGVQNPNPTQNSPKQPPSNPPPNYPKTSNYSSPPNIKQGYNSNQRFNSQNQTKDNKEDYYNPQ